MRRGAVGQKPPLPPKPSVEPAPAQKSSEHQRSSPAVDSKAKPAIAPKPCKIPPPRNFRPLKSSAEHRANGQPKPCVPRNVGLLNFRNGAHTDAHKPEWDYIIPICVCNSGDCVDCGSPNISETQTTRIRLEPNECKISANNVNASLLPDRTHGSKPPRRTPPVAKQRDVKMESMGRTSPVLTVLPVYINSPDVFQREAPNKPSVTGRRSDESTAAQNIRGVNRAVRDPQRVPVPAPRRNTPHKTQNERQNPPALETEVQAENLDVGVDSSESSELNIQYPVWKRIGQKPRPDIRRHCNMETTEVSVDGVLQKAKMLRTPLCEIKNEDCVDITDRETKPQHTFEGNDDQNQPCDVPSKKLSLSLKPKSKSLSSVDMRRPDGLKKTSLLRVMDLDLSLKKMPKLAVKNGQALDFTSVKNEQSVDAESFSEDHERRMPSCNGHSDRLSVKGLANTNNVEFEQSVDGDDLENTDLCDHIYEDITSYENLPPLNTQNTQFTSKWSFVCRDDGFYEIIETTNSTDSKQQQVSVKRSVFEESLDDDTNSEDESSSDEDNIHREPQLDAKRNKVANIVNEIFSSEKIFVNVLKLLSVDFREAVLTASSQAGKTVIDERVLNQILGSLPQLYKLNYNLLKELEERVTHWSECCTMADIFVKKGPYLKMYSTYIREFDKNVALLEEHCRKNPSFARVVREFESAPCCANLAVKHYMLKPVQRIPQYQLLLTAYLKNLDKGSPDYTEAEVALGIVKEVANHANEIIKQEGNSQRLYDIQCRLIGQHVIVQPGRVLLKEGTLMKSSRKEMQPRMFFLFNDSLLYTTQVPSGNFKVNNMLSLAGMKVSKRYQEGCHELNIESVERSFILSANSAACRDEWLQAISTAIEEYKKDISSRKPEVALDVPDNQVQLGTKAPIWIPDVRATMCMMCTCEFTLTWRRHHCRACGRVVCQACSTKKQPLKYLKNKIVRVCDQCFLELQQNTASGDQGTNISPLSPVKSPAFPLRGPNRPAALKEVSANTGSSSMSGYLERTKGNKKQWRRFWFVIMNKVLYTYAASEDVAALESQPLLGFSLKTEKAEFSLQFKLLHKNTLYFIFRANDSQTCQRWIEAFQEATVL